MERYQLLVNYEELDLDVRVNDMPVPLSGDAHGFSTSFINDLLTGAHNTVTVAARPPRGAAHTPAGASLHVNVTAFPAGAAGGAGRVLYDYEWKFKDPHAPLPRVSAPFQSEAPSEPLSWQNADEVQLTEADKRAINAQIKRLYDAMEARNVEETSALLASEVHDQAVGFGMPLADLEAQQRRGYQEDFSPPSWHLSPISEGALEYEKCGGGRVVLVHTRDGRKVFTSTPDRDGSSVAFDPYLARIKGQWVIIK